MSFPHKDPTQRPITNLQLYTLILQLSVKFQANAYKLLSANKAKMIEVPQREKQKREGRSLAIDIHLVRLARLYFRLSPLSGFDIYVTTHQKFFRFDIKLELSSKI